MAFHERDVGEKGNAKGERTERESDGGWELLVAENWEQREGCCVCCDADKERVVMNYLQMRKEWHVAKV